LQVSEHNLAEELQRKNASALEYLMNTYAGSVYALVGRILADSARKEDVEECTSDVFLTIWQNAQAFNPHRGSFKTWLLLTAKYKALDYRRKLIVSVEGYPLIGDQVGSASNVETKVLAKEERQQLVTAIETLGEPNKTIFYKRYFYYESIESIAKQLKLTRSAVDNRLWRCRRKLKNYLLSQKGCDLFEEL